MKHNKGSNDPPVNSAGTTRRQSICATALNRNSPLKHKTARPVVDARIKYVRPLRYGQELRVRAEIVEWENRLRLEYRIHDAGSGEKLTSACTVQVAVDAASGEMQYVSPPVLWERLGVKSA